MAVLSENVIRSGFALEGRIIASFWTMLVILRSRDGYWEWRNATNQEDVPNTSEVENVRREHRLRSPLTADIPHQFAGRFVGTTRSEFVIS